MEIIEDMKSGDALFVLGTNSFLNSDLIEYISNELRIDKRYVIVGRDHELNDFKNKFIAIMRSDCIRGKYNYQLSDYAVIDEIIINCMSRHSMELIRMQQRFEDFYDFRLSRDLENHLNIYMAHLKFWSGLLSNGRIKYVVLTDVPHEGYDGVIYYLCKLIYKDIKIVMRYISRIPGRAIIFDDITKIGMNSSASRQKGKGGGNSYVMSMEAQKYYKQLKDSQSQCINGAFHGANNREQWLQKRFGRRNILMVFVDKYLGVIYGHVFKFKCRLLKGLEAVFLFPKGLHQTIKSIPRVLYAIKQKKKTDIFVSEYETLALIKTKEDIPDDPYIYYAMHYQPEATSLPLGGGDYADQRIPVEVLSKSIPKDWKVLVKKHPGQNAQCANVQSYRLLRELKNVFIVSENVNSHDLMKEAEFVASLTGTIIMEALFLRKKAIVFGYSELATAPNAFYVRTINDCKSIIEEHKNSKLQYSDEDIKKYFIKLSENSFLDTPEEYAKQAVKFLKK